MPSLTVQQIKHRLDEKVRGAEKAAVARVRRIAKRAADKEADLLFQVIAKDFMNKTAKPALKAFAPFEWQMLDVFYMMKKGHPRFWHYSGALRDYMRGLSGLDTYGDTKVSLAKNKRGSYQVLLRPFWLLNDDLGDVLDPFTGAIDATGRVDYKLANLDRRGHVGQNRPYRPLMEPAILHFASVRIPRAVKRALKEAGA